MTEAAALPKAEPEESPLSPWWLRAVAIVLVVGFAGLLSITLLAYRNAAPIPARVVDASRMALFTRDDILDGQALFLRYGLMDNGTVWGHGAYLGPDYAAEALHRIGEDTAAGVAQREYGKLVDDLTAVELAAVRSEVAIILKTNRYDAASDTLRLTEPESFAYRQQIEFWTSYFHEPARNGGLKPDLITDPTELKQLTAFIVWAAWASVANRPGANYSYTNNFPYDPDVGNRPTAGALLWSALSLLALLAAIAGLPLAFGKFDYLGWITRGHRARAQFIPGVTSPGQRAISKFFVVVGLLFLAQALIGGGVAHYRAEP